MFIIPKRNINQSDLHDHKVISCPPSLLVNLHCARWQSGKLGKKKLKIFIYFFEICYLKADSGKFGIFGEIFFKFWFCFCWKFWDLISEILENKIKPKLAVSL